MHEQIFADSFRQAQSVVLGLRLKDYSLGHELLLFQRENALLTISLDAFHNLDLWHQIFAIRDAAWICSDPYRIREKINFDRFPYLKSRWDNFKRWIWLKSIRRLDADDYALAAVEFRNYLWLAHTSMPGPEKRAAEVCAEAGGYASMNQMAGRGFGSPLISRLLDFAIERKLHEMFPGMRSPLELGYGYVLNLYETHLETEGKLWIENADERQEKEDFERDKKAFIEKEKSEIQKSKNGSLPVGLASDLPEELKVVLPPKEADKS